MSGITRRGFVKGAALAPLALTPFSFHAQQAAPAERFDIVVAGAGHNSLVCAASGESRLTRSSCWRASDDWRGCKTAEVCLRGFKEEDLCSSVHSGIQSNPLLRVNELICAITASNTLTLIDPVHAICGGVLHRAMEGPGSPLGGVRQDLERRMRRPTGDCSPKFKGLFGSYGGQSLPALPVLTRSRGGKYSTQAVLWQRRSQCPVS